MSSFEFATAARVVFGAGKLAEAPSIVRELGGGRVLLVRGRSAARAASLEAALGREGLSVVSLVVAGEPTLDVARDGAALAVREKCDAVVAVGGGSVLDAGKAVAALATNGGEPLEFLEVIGRGRPLTTAPLPVVCAPTTAGTGSEVTKNAVLGSKDARVKASLRSAAMVPKVALVDPDLLNGAPPDVLASSGLDALSQLVEPFLSLRRQPLTDALAREGIRRSSRSLRVAVEAAREGRDAGAAAREDLALASLFGGMCLANAGLGAVHGFAAPAGGMFDAPHGAVCAALLPPVLAANLHAVRARAETIVARDLEERFDELARLVTGRANARAEEGIAHLEALTSALAVPGLSRYGMTARDVPALVEKAKAASSMKANPIALTDAELTRIAERAL